MHSHTTFQRAARYGSDAGGWADEKSAIASTMDTTASTMLLLADVGTGDWDGSRGGGWQTAVRCTTGHTCAGDYPGATTVLSNLAKRHSELNSVGTPSMTLHLGDISYVALHPQSLALPPVTFAAR
jgi:hypothetical protein